MALPGFGAAAQERLCASTVLVIGAGGLGSPALLYLAAAGVGRIVILDPDKVELSNLQRQIIFTMSDLASPKAEAAAARLQALWPELCVEPHVSAFTAENARRFVRDCDAVVDGSDNFATRYLTSDVCAWEKKPNVYASIYRYEGQATVFAPHLGAPCYRCLFPVPPPPEAVPSCADGGVLGVLPGIMGSLQAGEAIKLLTGTGEPLTGRLCHVDLRTSRFREIRLRPDPECPVCGKQPSIFEPVDYAEFCGVRQLPAHGGMDEAELRQLLATAPTRLCVLDVRELWESALQPWPHAQLHIPWAALPERVGELPAAARIVTVCREGRRSAAAAGWLTEAGWPHTRWLRTGLMDWEE